MCPFHVEKSGRRDPLKDQFTPVTDLIIKYVQEAEQRGTLSFSGASNNFLPRPYIVREDYSAMMLISAQITCYVFQSYHYRPVAAAVHLISAN